MKVDAYPDDVVRAAFHRAQVDGTEPNVVSMTTAAVADPIDLLPPGSVVTRSATTSDTIAVLARDRGCTILLEQGLRLIIRVSSPHGDDAQAVLTTIVGRIPVPEPDGTVAITTWYLVGQ